jgi:dolichol-phosphate mannosyltransferase
VSDSAPHVSVVLPTYEESESLPVLIPSIIDTLNGEKITGEVIVVDDNSPDGTAEVAQKLALQYPVRVLKRVSERGLATAVMAGFEMSHSPVLVVMDADGSHPVEALPQMVRMIADDRADIVVGSRHVPGGGSQDWPLVSRVKSRLAASVARGLTPMTDPTTGFMAVRGDLVTKLDLDPVGWKIVLEVVAKAPEARLAEVPIIFGDRQLGQSKQSLRVAWQYFDHLLRLYRYRYGRLLGLKNVFRGRTGQ